MVNLNDMLNCLPSKTTCLVKDSGLYLIFISQIIANFVSNFSKFSLPWQQGQSRVNLNDIVKLHEIENPLFGTRISTVSLT